MKRVLLGFVVLLVMGANANQALAGGFNFTGVSVNLFGIGVSVATGSTPFYSGTAVGVATPWGGVNYAQHSFAPVPYYRPIVIMPYPYPVYPMPVYVNVRVGYGYYPYQTACMTCGGYYSPNRYYGPQYGGFGGGAGYGNYGYAGGYGSCGGFGGYGGAGNCF